MDEETAKKFAKEKFQQLGEVDALWNFNHSAYIIKALQELSNGPKTNMPKLKALAWVHDIGKTEGDENHPEKGLKILEKHFELDEIDKDCILNHGSSGKPTTNQGKLFRYADGISLFYPETILTLFWGFGKESKSFQDAKKFLEKAYNKYLEAYKDNQKAIILLRGKYELFLEKLN